MNNSRFVSYFKNHLKVSKSKTMVLKQGEMHRRPSIDEILEPSEEGILADMFKPLWKIVSTNITIAA